MEFKRANHSHLTSIMGIIKGAQAYLKNQGVDQWQNNYPNEETITNDIKHGNSYMLLKDKKVIGTVAVMFGPDQTYRFIYNGKWMTNGAYGVIHRMAIDPSYHGTGLASIMIKYIEEMCKNKAIKSIRIDTHRENASMKSLLLKNGFEYCGIIYLADGNERLAYEKKLKTNSK